MGYTALADLPGFDLGKSVTFDVRPWPPRAPLRMHILTGPCEIPQIMHIASNLGRAIKSVMLDYLAAVPGRYGAAEALMVTALVVPMGLGMKGPHLLATSKKSMNVRVVHAAHFPRSVTMRGARAPDRTCATHSHQHLVTICSGVWIWFAGSVGMSEKEVAAISALSFAVLELVEFIPPRKVIPLLAPLATRTSLT
jgi:hypothetical protein